VNTDDANRAALGFLRHIAIFSSDDPKHDRSAIGDSRDAKRPCTVLHDPNCR
jgi:hypothetical protein